jgi:hypothetical protein
VAEKRIENTWDPLKLNKKVQEDLGQHIFEELKQSDRNRERFIRHMKRADLLFEGHGRKTKQTPFKDASDIHIPMTPTFTSAIHARYFTTLFSQPNFWVFRPLNPKLKDKMASMEIFMRWVTGVLMDWENEIFKFTGDATRYPLAVMRLGWKREEGPWIHYDSNHKIVSEKRVIRSGPEAISWPPEDFFWPVAFDNIQKMPWVGFRSWIPPVQVRQMEKQNRLFNMEDSLKALPRRRTWSIPTSGGVDIKEQRERHAGLDATESHLLEMIEYWTLFDIQKDNAGPQKIRVAVDPNQLPDPRAMKIVSLHPFMHDRWPGLATSYERRPHQLPGLGIPQQVGDLNDVLDTIHNQNLDQAHVATIDMLLHPQASAYADAFDEIWPGKRGAVPQPDQVIPISLGSLKASSVGLEAHVRNYMERRTFMSDFSLGREPSPSRRGTATGTLAIIQEGNKHFDASIKDGRRELTEGGYQILELCAQLMPREDIVAALGEDVAADVEEVIRGTGPIRMSVGLEVAATSATINRDVQRQNSILLFNIWVGYADRLWRLAQQLLDPRAAQIPGMRRLGQILSEKAGNLMTDIARTFERHPDEIIPDSTEIAEILGGQFNEGSPPAPAVPGIPGAPQAGLPGAGNAAAATGILSALQPGGAGEPSDSGGGGAQ